MQFDGVTEAVDSALRAKDADMSVAGERNHLFHRRADHTQHIRYLRSPAQGGQIVLLDRAEGFGTGGVACQDNKGAIVLQEIVDRLQRILVDDLEGVRTIGCTRIVAQVEIVIPGQLAADLIQNSQSAVTAVENTNFHCLTPQRYAKLSV